MNNEKLIFSKSKELLKMNFGSHIRLAVDSKNNIYLSSFDFSRIDVFDIENKILKTYLENISHPVDIAIDNNRHILFWIENWSCVSQTFINDINVMRMCSINARAIAVDILNGELFWSDSFGRIFKRKYFEKSVELVFTAKKMNQNHALFVTTRAIYVSDLFKLTAIDRSTLNEKVVLIESPGILAFKSISLKECNSTEMGLKNIEYNLTKESNVITMSPINRSLTFDLEENSHYIKNYWFGSKYSVYIIVVSILTFFALILLLFILKRFYRKNNSNRTQIKRISGRKTKKFLLNDKNKLLSNGRNSKTVCIEDMGSFSNNGYLDPQTFCSNCPIRQTCSSCDDKEECLERGICLTTYKLLT